MSPKWILVCLLVIACDTPTDQKATPTPSSASAAPSVTAPPQAQVEAKPVELRLLANAATMVFDRTELSVPAGSTVHLVLENKGPGTLPHNWALVNPGTEAKVAADGLAKGEAANYVAPSSDLLAYTKLVKPGTTAEVTFKAPTPGKYPYICTFPGHYIMMKGVLTVTPP